MKKRILSMIIAIVMVVGLIPGGALTALAAETDCSYANPHQIQLPYTSETLNLTYDSGWDHYYTWTAPEAGALTVVMPEGLHCDIFIDGYTADSGINTTLTADVAAGEVVILNVYTLDDVNGTWSASFAAGETTAPEGGETTTPEGGETTTPEGGETTTPEGGETTAPEGGETTGTLDIYLKLKAVNAEGEDISNLGNGLDVVLNGGEWVGTYSGTGDDDGKFNVIIGENTLSGWDYCPTGYDKPADVTFTVAADGTVTCNDSHVTVEKDGDFTVLVITLEAGSSEGGETTTPEGGEISIPEGAVEITDQNALPDLSASYDSTVGWSGELNPDDNVGYFSLDLKAGDVLYYTYVGEAYYFYLFENDRYDFLEKESIGSPLPRTDFFTIEADGNYSFCSGQELTLHAWLVRGSAGEGGETTTPEGGDSGEISIPDDAVEITSNDTDGLPEEVIPVLGSYDAANGYWVPFAMDTQYIFFAKNLNEGDELYLVFSEATEYIFGVMTSPGDVYTANGIVRFVVTASDAYAVITKSDVKLKAYVVPADSGESGESGEGGDIGETTATPIYVGGVEMNDGDYLANGATTVSDSAPATGGYAHFAVVDGKATLTLNNYTYSGAGGEAQISGNTDGAAIYYGGSDTLYLTLQGESSVTHTGGGNYYNSYGIFVDYSLEISGTGSLSVSGGSPDPTRDGISYGIYSGYGDVTLLSGAVTAIGGNAPYRSVGVGAGNITVFGGSLTAVGNMVSDADNGWATESFGIIAWGTITVSGGSVKATSATNADYSFAMLIYSESEDGLSLGGGMAILSPADARVVYDEGWGAYTVSNGTSYATEVEIGEEPVCTHENTVLSCNSDGTHNIVCADGACRYVVEANVTCTVDDTATVEFVLSEPSCINEGIKQVITYCACGYQLSNDGDVPIPATGVHLNLREMPGVTPDCVNAGYRSYWVCDMSCPFEDEGATVPIEDLGAWVVEGGDGYLPRDRTNHIGDDVQYTASNDSHDGVYVCCGGEYVTDEPHDFTYDAENHECICGKVEPVDLTFVLDGGTLTGEFAEMWGENGENGTIPFATDYGLSVYTSTLYVPEALVKDGYYITGFKDQDGNFYDISDDTDIITFLGDTTLTVQWEEYSDAGGEGGETGHTHTYDNGYYYSDDEYHYAYCDTCDYYDLDSAEAHYEDAAYEDHHCDVCGAYVRAWCTPIDPETDHRCINGENCGARLDDLCTDADNDHVCDGCGDDMGWLCEDTGADHLCDVCDAYMRELCEDADEDHICDAEGCGERISPCDDVDNDNKCDICDAELRAAWNDADDDGVIDEGETVYSLLYNAFIDPAATIIKLLDDVSDFSVFLEEKAVTLDLNGHTVTLNGWFDISTAASLTMKDSSTAKTGRIICDIENSYYMDVYSDGMLTLQGGTVDQIRLGENTAAITLTGGTVGKMIVMRGEVILGDTNVAQWKISGGTFNVDPTTLNGFDSDNYEVVNNNDGTWTVQEKNPDDFVDEHFHDKEGYEVIWSENFDGETFPEEFTAVDKDGDDHGWHISAYEGHVHGCTDGSAVVSYSYINETATSLNSNNLLLTPTLELEEGKEYLLSFMVKAVDESYPDSYDIHISLDGGETYDWSRGVQESPEAWEEVVLDLSAYAGKNVTVVIEHKDYDMFCLAVDCFYLYEKSATGGEGDSEGEEFTGVSLYASSLTLDGTIGLNFYFRLGDDVLASQDAFVRFSLEDGRIIEIPVAEGVAAEVEGVTYYKFTCKMYAKQMSDTVKIQVFDGETALTQELEHSVVDYATVLLQMADTNPAYADVAPLIEAMLHYGARAQLYFGYNTEKLADAGIDAADLSGVTAATFESYRATGMTIDGIGKFVSSNLVLESETTLKLYFLADEGVDASALEFTVGNEVITPTTYGEYLVIAITDIMSDELDNEFTVTVTNGTEAQGSFTTSVYAYCYKTLLDEQGLYNDEIKDTLKALYLYNVAADAYFN